MIDIVVLILCVFVGFVLGRRSERMLFNKERLFTSMHDFARNLLYNARYTKLPLKEFVENYNAGNGAEVFSQCVDRYFYGKDIAISAKLTAQQQKYIEDFWHNLSALNTEQFVGHVEYYGNYFADQSEKLRKECADKASLGPKLGILIGAIVGLMLM